MNHIEVSSKKKTTLKCAYIYIIFFHTHILVMILVLNDTRNIMNFTK